MEVAAAVILREDKVLVCQRRHDDSHPLKWEFPGGKLELGETPEAALQRELEEELCIQAHIGPLIDSYDYRYGSRAPIRLNFHRVSEYFGELENQVFEQIRWEALERLPEYDFVAGDVDFVKRLARGEYSLLRR